MGLVITDQLPAIKPVDGLEIKAVTADTMTVSYVTIKQGVNMPEHSHYHEQVVNVTEGELELTVEGIKHSLTPGRAMVLAPNVPHSAYAVTDVKVIDVFHPVRHDFADYSKK